MSGHLVGRAADLGSEVVFTEAAHLAVIKDTLITAGYHKIDKANSLIFIYGFGRYGKYRFVIRV